MRNDELKDIKEAVKIAKALADTSRLRIAAALMSRDELCVCQLTELLGLAMSTVSRHVSLLEEARIVRSRKEGKWVYYSLAKGIPTELFGWLESNILKTRQAKNDLEKLKNILTVSPKGSCENRKDKDEK